jgi:hypothetical protein
VSFRLLFSSAEYGGEISFFNGFYRLVIVRKTISLFLLEICTFSISCYIWVRARALIRFIFSKILSFGLTIVKMILSEFRPLKAFRDLGC